MSSTSPLGQGSASPLGRRGASCSLYGLLPASCLCSLESCYVLPRFKDAVVTYQVKIDTFSLSDAGQLRSSVSACAGVIKTER